MSSFLVEKVGLASLHLTEKITGFSRLLWQTARAATGQMLRRELRLRHTVAQAYAIAVESLPVMIFSLTFISLMLIVEFSYHMKLVIRQDSLVPSFSTVLMIRELGPVVTCLLLASRIGAGIAAEIGIMKITDQLDALRLLAIDPVEFLTVPRWLGCLFASLTLSVVSIGVAIVGGAGIASAQLGYTRGQFFNAMFAFTHLSDFSTCFAKAAVFGTIIPIVASHHGFRCEPGAQGVGNASTSAVVDASLSIIMADFLLTYLRYAVY